MCETQYSWGKPYKMSAGSYNNRWKKNRVPEVKKPPSVLLIRPGIKDIENKPISEHIENLKKFER